MKFRALKNDIIKAIKVLSHAVNAETMKMLGGILIDANSTDPVELTAYSKNVKIKYYVSAAVEQTGSIVCDPKYLKNIPNGNDFTAIIQTNDSNVIQMKIGAYKQRWQGAVAENYPRVESNHSNKTLMIEQDRFKDILTKTIPFASPTVGYRPQYNGILFEVRNGILHNVATDGKRMAHITTPIDTTENMSFIISLPAAKELCRMDGENPVLRMDIDDKNMQLMIDYSDFIVVASTMYGNGYVKYDDMMNVKPNITAKVSRSELMQMTERSKFVSEQGKTKVPVTLELHDDVLQCSGINLRCRLNDEIDADVTGSIRIGFNAEFLWDMVKTIQSDVVVLELKSPSEPLIIREKDTELLLLPVKL